MLSAVSIVVTAPSPARRPTPSKPGLAQRPRKVIHVLVLAPVPTITQVHVYARALVPVHVYVHAHVHVRAHVHSHAHVHTLAQAQAQVQALTQVTASIGMISKSALMTGSQ
jgi:hypothetical protein